MALDRLRFCRSTHEFFRDAFRSFSIHTPTKVGLIVNRQHLFTRHRMRLLDRFTVRRNAPQYQTHGVHEELFRFIQQRKFDLVLKFLLVDQDYGREAILSFSSSDTGNFLHVLLCYRPTLELVALTIHLMTTKNSNELVPEDTRNASGETPLHVAVQHNCHVSIVRLLVKGMAGILPAVTKDDLLRYPLHWACEHVDARNSKSKNQLSTSHEDDLVNLRKIINVLSRIEPMTVNLKDINGQTPLDLALASCVDEKIIKTLEEAAAKARRRHDQWHSSLDNDYPNMVECASGFQDDASSVSWPELAMHDDTAMYVWERSFKRDSGFELVDNDKDHCYEHIDGELHSVSTHSGAAVHLTQS